MKFFLVFLVLLVSCINIRGDLSQKKILTTTGMVGDIVAHIAGDGFTVDTLMGVGIDPHSYKASARDLEKLTQASIIVYSGIHLEAKMGEIFEKLAPYRPVFAISDEFSESELIETESGQHDPHIWFDIPLWSSSGAYIVKKLSEYYPELKNQFQQNYENYQLKMNQLNSRVIEALSTIDQKKRIMVTAHDAFNYFGRRYGFRVEGIQGISTVAEASTNDISRVVKTLVDNNINTVFVESSVSDRTIRALQEAARDLNHEVGIGESLFSDAMGSKGSESGNYEGMIWHNTMAIVKGLGGKQ